MRLTLGGILLQKLSIYKTYLGSRGSKALVTLSFTLSYGLTFHNGKNLTEETFMINK